MDFIVIDIETANPNYHSICQIGLVQFSGGTPTVELEIWIDPQEPYATENIQVHGITAADTAGKPTFSEVAHQLHDLLAGQTVASHTSFDRSALSQACKLHKLEEIDCEWIDTATAARRGWKEYSQKGYGLKNLARVHGIEFTHHNALEDARTAGLIFTKLLKETDTKPSDWTTRGLAQAAHGSANWKNYPESLKKTAPSEGPLSHHIITFTGNLSLARSEAAKLATNAGAGITASPTKKTTLVVVGAQDLKVVGDDGKSSKQKKAEQLIAEGSLLRIISEVEFLELIATPHQ